MKYLTIIAILLSSCIYGQTENLKIVKIIDANLFELESGHLVRMKGIDVPSIVDENDTLRVIAYKAKKYAEATLLNRSFEISYKYLNTSKTFYTYLIDKNSQYTYDFQLEYIKNGYARINDDIDSSKSIIYKKYQDIAKESEKGIWFIEDIENNIAILKNFSREVISRRLSMLKNIEDLENNLFRKKDSRNNDLNAFPWGIFGSIAGAVIGGSLGKDSVVDSFFGAFIGIPLGFMGGVSVYAVVSWAFEKKENKFQKYITHKDIYNSSKLIDVNVLRINF